MLLPVNHTLERCFSLILTLHTLIQLPFFQRSHCRTCSAAVCVTCHVVVNNAVKVILLWKYVLIILTLIY